jgi:hypothetical protein
MISETPIRMVSIRPHHIPPFAEYWMKGNVVLDGPDRNRHTPQFALAIAELYKSIIEDVDSIGILLVDGSRGDSICDLCDVAVCDSRNSEDNLSVWNGHGLVMQYSGFEFGKIYSSKEFKERVRQVYPHTLPKE